MRLHDARHTFASLALAAGRSIRWVAERRASTSFSYAFTSSLLSTTGSLLPVFCYGMCSTSHVTGRACR